MIARRAQSRPTTPWRRELAAAVTSAAELLELLELEPAAVGASPEAARAFPLRVPRPFVARMRRGDPQDPLLLQVLPAATEMEEAAGFVADPLGEAGSGPTPGLLHKYRGRVLVVATGACAIHCRYCFRRHFPYGEELPAPGRWRGTLDYLAGRPEVEELILSGGDPLVIPDERLATMVAEAEAAAPGLRRLRIHTRLPVVLPSRVDDRLAGWLSASRLAVVVVLHANHPREIEASVAGAVERLRAAGATLLNQSVLLAGVNDSVEALCELSERLFEAGVVPYYLHLLDPVAGAAHFEVAEPEARRLWREMAARLPGYLVPRLVREVPGAPAKVVLGES